MPTVWKPRSSNERQATRVKQLVHPPVSMGADMCRAVLTSKLPTKDQKLELDAVEGKAMHTTNILGQSIQKPMQNHE